MPEPGTAYDALAMRFRRVSLLGEAAGLLGWDSATFMPRGGAAARADQIAELERVRHEALRDPRMAEWLDRAESESTAMEGWRRVDLAAMRRRWRRADALDPALESAMTRARLACEMAWREARPADDFAGLAPLFEEVVRRVREVAAALGEALGCAPYDAMLDGYQPGLRAADFEPVFDDLAAFLPGFVAEAMQRQARRPPAQPPRGPFPVAAQRALARELMAAVGFSFENGRLDESAHPFSGGVADDLRVTTRYDEGDFMSSLMAALHETGHALYDRNLPRRWRHRPVGEALGMAMHESQSLLVEMQACRSRGFFEFAAPAMRRAFGGAGPEWSAENLYRAATRVEPGAIRVDADEATYPAHILLRTRLERALLSGDLAVGDLPGAWREEMRRLLGVAPETDRDGCLQDIHWMDGDFGYFPTYTLGAIAAAQLFAAARAADPTIEPGIAAGDFSPLLGWLKAHVHGHASVMSMDALLERATGRALDLAAYTGHLRARYCG